MQKDMRSRIKGDWRGRCWWNCLDLRAFENSGPLTSSISYVIGYSVLCLGYQAIQVLGHGVDYSRQLYRAASKGTVEYRWLPTKLYLA